MQLQLTVANNVASVTCFKDGSYNMAKNEHSSHT
jgi:hypothetical protein